MATRFCSRCGAVLRDGACPRGHPQRALRSRRRQRRKWPIVILALAVLVAAGAYLALQWYPARAAGDLMRPSSAEFTEALQAYRAAVESLPLEDTDPETVAGSTEDIQARAEAARQALSAAQLSLEDRSAPRIPVVTDRPPLDEALAVRDTMLSFYTEALETTAGLDGVARYLSGLTETLPEVDEVENSLLDDNQAGGVATAQSVAGRIVADLQAITPPEELGALHSSLAIVARRIEDDLQQIEETQGQASQPVIQVLLDDVAEQASTFRDTVAQVPQAAIDAGLGSTMARLERRVGRITSGLMALRDQGVMGLVIPS